jgi:hypothetical protein
MTQDLTTAVAEVAEVVAAISGIGAAPATPQENINERVFALTYLMTCETEISELGTKQHIAVIAVDLLTPHTNLAQNISELLPIVDLLDAALITETTTVSAFFDNSIDTYTNLRWEFVPAYNYSGVDCVCYRAMLEGVKQKINL